MQKILLFFLMLALAIQSGYSQSQRLDSLIKELPKVKNDSIRIKYLCLISFDYLFNAPEKSYIYSKRALKLATANEDSFGIAYSNLHLGLYYEAVSDFEQSLSHSFKALKIAEKIKDGYLIQNLYNNIGLVYLDTDNLPLALKYFEERLQKAKLYKNEHSSELAATYTNIGVAYLRQSEYQKAKEAFNRSLNINIKAKDTVSIILGYANLATVCIPEKNYKEGLSFCDIAYPMAVAHNQKTLEAEILLILTQLYEGLKDYENAEKYLNKAMVICRETNSGQYMMDSYLLMSDFAKSRGRYKEALKYYELFNDLQDSLFSSEKNKKMMTMEAQYRTKQKEQENKLLKAENEKNLALVNKQHIAIISGILGILFVLWVSFLIYRSKRKEQKTNSLLRSQKQEIKKQNEKLKQLNEEVMAHNDSIQIQNRSLEHLNSVKNHLLSVISHDVRSPLNSIKGTLELLEHGYINEEEIKEVAGKLKGKVDNTSMLLDNLLHWTRSQMDGLQVRSAEVDLQQVAEQNFQLYAPMAEEKGVLLQNLIYEPVYAFADPEMIMTVVRNLLANALKFTETNGFVKLEAQNNEDHIIFSVKDSGVGMTREQANQLFKESHYSTPGTNHEVGTGLGLLLCKDYLKKNGGKIWVESEFNSGSSFYFSLPKGN